MIYSKIWGDYYALTYRHIGQLISSHLKANEVGGESLQHNHDDEGHLLIVFLVMLSRL
jgi:hypothetical protein